MRPFLHRFSAVAGLLLFAFLCTALIGAEYIRGRAATLIVTSTADSGAGSLRDTIAAASDGDTIQFDPALKGQTISLTSGELAINKNITINGPGPSQLALSSSRTSRIFHLLPGHNATITGLAVWDGFADNGGGVLNDHATLTIDNCLIDENSALAQSQSAGKGGGIYNDGSGGTASLTIRNSTVVDNFTSVFGGGIYNSEDATLTLTNSVAGGNQAFSYGPFNSVQGSGGGIANDGMLTITDSAINNNRASVGPFPTGSGGGIWSSSTVTITNSVINGNIVGGGGGGLSASGIVAITNTTIIGNLAGGGGGIDITAPSTVTIANSTLTGNAGYIGGGAIINQGSMMITDTTISRNSTGIGGGIYNYNDGTVELHNSAIYGNSAAHAQFGSLGGGIYNSYNGAVFVRNCTISDNYAATYGAAIFNDFRQSLVRGCEPEASGPNPTLIITNSTISGNQAGLDGGIYNTAGHCEFVNTILTNCSSAPNIVSVGGTVTSRGYNLSNDDGAGFLASPGDQINTDPLLGPLQDNGGPTFTNALLAGSPAIDAGDPDFTPPPPTDQRGYPRVYNDRIDIGSVELQPIPTTTPSPAPTASPTTTKLANISTRLHVGTGSDIGIGGFIITGAGNLQVVLRGIGPSLCQQGFPTSLADPILELRDSTGALLARNDNWQDDFAQVPALIQLGLAPIQPSESALLQSLPPGAYTAILAGVNGSTGVGLVEVYNVDRSVPVTNNQLANISTRALVGTGTDVVIGGFILGGGDNTNLLIRGIGPSLAAFGIPNPLADPTLELRDNNGALLASNDNCTGSSIPPTDPLEACIDISLPAGPYTTILAGKDGGTGVGLIEIYNLN